MATYKNTITPGDRVKPFKMTWAAPLDINGYFESLSEAQAAAETAKDAGDTSTSWYYGQIISVTLDGIPTIYKIQKAKQATITYHDPEDGDDHTNDIDYVIRNIIYKDNEPYSADVNGVTTLFTTVGNGKIISVELNSTELILVGWEVGASSSTFGSDGFITAIAASDYLSLVSSYYGKLISLEQAGEVGDRVLQQAKAYTDSEIDKLDVSDSEVGGQYVSSVSESNGKITVTRTNLPSQTDTAVSGQYVSQVTQSNGQISVTRTDLPSQTDTAVSGQFVTQVTQSAGQISVTRAGLQSSDLPNVPVTKLTLGASGEKIDASLLPSYVDDVIELKNITGTVPENPSSGDSYYSPNSAESNKNKILTYNGTSWVASDPESGKIYVDLSDNKTYRYGGSASSGLVVISETLALGETSSTAFSGDKGKTAYDHATDSSRLTTAQSSGLYKISVTSEGHIGSVTEAQASDIPGQSSKADKVTSATNGHVAGLDGNGNLTDTGLVADNVLEKSGNLTNGNIVKANSNGELVDASIAASDIVTKVTTAVGSSFEGNVPKLDSNGKIVDSGISATDIVTNISGKINTISTPTAGTIVVSKSDGHVEEAKISGTPISKDVLQSAANRTNDNDLGLISKSQLEKVTGDESVPGSIAEAYNYADRALTNSNDLAEFVGEIPSGATSDTVVDYAEEYADTKSAFLGTTSSIIDGTGTGDNNKQKSDTITVGGSSIKANVGDIAIYNGKEYRWTGATNGWVLMYETGAQVNVIESIKIGTGSTKETFSVSNKTAEASQAQLLSALSLKFKHATNTAKDSIFTYNPTSNESEISAASIKETLDLDNVANGAQVNVVESVSLGGDDVSHPKKTFAQVGSTKEYNLTASDARTALNVADGAQVNVVEGVKVKYGTNDIVALTPDANKTVTVDLSSLILDGGSATA